MRFLVAGYASALRDATPRRGAWLIRGGNCGSVRAAPDPRMSVKPAAATSVGRVDPFGLVGARLDSRYDVVDVVAQGGFGVVYRAQHRELRKPVAIKVLKTPGDLTQRQQRDFLLRFTEEARTVAQLDHAHVVRVLDFGTSIMPSGAKAPWMALEWLEGQTLEADFNQRIETGSPGRTPAETIALMYPVIEAVGIAHEEGIVHRDIKPGNLMIVTGRRGHTRLKLLDFGIAKVMGAEERRAADRAQTLTQVQAFSPDYAAPEQVSGMRTGPWTDVHALALLMSEMLTAQIPYEGGDAMEMCANVLSPQRPTPGDRGVDVGPWEPVFARALALRPSDRYENAAEFLSALMNALPPGVDDRDTDLWSSQTGAHRREASPSEPRSSSLPPPPSSEPLPSNPTPTDGIPRLEVPRYTPSFVPPSSHPPPGEEDGRATTVMASVSVPPRAPLRPGPPTPPPPAPPDDLAEFTLDEPEVDAPVTPAEPALAPAPSYPPLRSSSSLRPPPRSRPAAGALVVGLGLLFGGLVSGAVVLLLRGAFPARPPAAASVLRPSPARRAPPPVAAPPAVVATPIVPAVAVDAAPAPVAVDAAAAPAPMDAAVADDGHRSRHRSRHRSTHRSTHRRHRHRDAPAD